MSQHLEQWVDQLMIRLYDMVGGLTTEQLEEVARNLLAALHEWGDELLAHLDPPAGLKRWLESHGLSLVPTHEPARPRSWNEIEEVSEDRGPVASHAKEGNIAHVFDKVSYRTSPSGPRAESLLGTGEVMSVRWYQNDIDKLVYTVRTQGTQRLVHLCPADGDELWHVHGDEEVAT